MFGKQQKRQRKKGKRKSCSGKDMEQILQDFDSFGEPVNLSFNGTSTNKTMAGGILSIFLYSGLLFYFIWRMTLMKGREKDDLMQTDFYRDLEAEGKFFL